MSCSGVGVARLLRGAWCAAWWPRALSPGAGPVASAGPQRGPLAAGRHPAPMGRVGCSPRPARGLHGALGPEPRAAGGGRPEAGAADHAGPRFDIDMLVSLLRQENARDICVIKVPAELKYTDYFVVGSGTSPRHLHAMACYLVKMGATGILLGGYQTRELSAKCTVGALHYRGPTGPHPAVCMTLQYKFLKCKSDPHVQIEGKNTDDWLCMDFGSMVIHLMLPETRELYELEKLWTLRAYDDQLAQITPETLPEDFILGIEEDALAPMEPRCE